MKKLLTVLMMTIAAFGVTLCDAKNVTVSSSGELNTEKRDVQKFKSISVSAGIIVHFSQSRDYSVTVKADKKILPYVNTEVNSGNLIVGYERGVRISTRGVKTEVFVTAPDIVSLSASSSGNISVKGSLKTNSLIIRASSSGDVNMENVTCNGSLNADASSSGDVNIGTASCSGSMTTNVSSSGDVNIDMLTCKDLGINSSSNGDVNMKVKATVTRVKVSSNADVTMEGTSDEFFGDSSSSGKIYADNLICRKVEASVSSAGRINIHATDSFSGRASSAGDITYHGNPKVESVHTSSAGNIRRK